MLPSFPKDLRVKNLLPGIDGSSFAHALTWKRVNGVSNYNVYRSYIPYGSFESIASVSIEGYTDTSLPFLYDSEPYYRISSVNYQGEGLPCEPQSDENNLIYNSTIHTHPDKTPAGSNPSYNPNVNPMPSDMMRRYQFNMIRRKALWQLEDIGEDVWLFKRKQPNPANIDDTREYGRETDYYPAIKILVRMVSFAETKLQAEYGFRRDKIPRSWTVWVPRINDHDIIVDRKNRRYEVRSVTPHYFKGLQISHQDFDMLELPFTDQAYKNAQLRIEGSPL